MANQFTALPAPAGNGSGAPVDVSTFGLFKTVTYVLPSGFYKPPTVIIEFSNEFVPTHFAPLSVLGQPNEVVIPVAAHWMRVTVTNYHGGGAPEVNVGGNDTGTSFATLIAPSKSGLGLGVDTSSLGAIKTIHVASDFRGVLNIEISEDAGATYNQVCSFHGPGHRTLTFAADFMRATRAGVPAIGGGVPLINIGAVPDTGGGLGGIIVEDEGVALGMFTTLNFTGPGVTATDAGGGVAQINVAAVPDTKQVFRYVVTGLEPGNPFTVPLPAARASINYNVFIQLAGPQANAFKDYRPLEASYAVNQFDVECGAVPDVGDILEIIVEDLT